MGSIFRSIASMFSNPRTMSVSHLQRRDQAMSSTHDAFSIPNHSPTFPSTSFQDAQEDTSYTYPPAPSPNTYDFSPSPNSYTRSQRPSSLLPVHHPPSASQPCPDVQLSWSRIQAWLAREYPELGDTLNYGILQEDLAQAEMNFGFTLPHAVRESYLQVDGQERESSAGCTEGLFFGLYLLPLEDVFDEWRFWREVDEDPATGANPKLKQRMKSIPTGWVRHEYSYRGWIPLITDRVGNYIGVDLSPGEAGVAGQVIVFGRDFDTKVVLWRSEGEGGWARFLAAFAEELEHGETFEIGPTDRDSEGSEDSIGDEPYFFDGSAHGKRGDGGGDHVVGLRLHREYKGWPAMEALADRSVKRWKDVGLIKDDDYSHTEPRRSMTLNGISAYPQDRAIEIPIPLIADFADPADRGKPLPPEPETPRPRMHNQSTSSLSVNRPAPQPIDLPTARDIVADVEADFDTDTIHGSTDLERGLGLPMREVDRRTAQTASNGGSLALSKSDSGGLEADGSLLSPRMSGEESTLLAHAIIVPPSVTITEPETPPPPPPPTKSTGGVATPERNLIYDDTATITETSDPEAPPKVNGVANEGPVQPATVVAGPL